MNLETVFNFIKEKRGYNYPLVYKLVNGLTLTDDELNVKGDLDLSRSNLVSLPDNLTVGGDLNIYRSEIKELPSNLRVERDLLLWKTPLSVKYDDDDIRKMIEDKGGYIGGEIYWW